MRRAVLLAALAISGCGSTPRPAPIIDRTPDGGRAAAPRAPVPAAGAREPDPRPGSYTVRRGDTLFANQYLAYESLSPGMQRLLDGLVAVNTSAKADVSKTREDRLRSDGSEEARKQFAAEHPVVRTHPETGRRALFVNIAHTSHFKDMTEEESAPILQFLHQHQVKPEFTCRFAWEVGSLAFWDNRCTQHNPVNDYHGYRRVMHRITLGGDKPL